MEANAGGQKNLIVILSLIIIFLIGVIVWLSGRPSLDKIRAPSGSTKYLVAVGEVGNLEIYSTSGERWDACRGEQCEKLFPRERISCNAEGYHGFFLASRDQINLKYESKSSLLDSLVKPAFAQEVTVGPRDDKCPIIYEEWFNENVSIPHYPSTREDPDCPPQH